MIESIVATSAGFAAGVAGAVCAGVGGACGIGFGVWVRFVRVSTSGIAINESKRFLILSEARRTFIVVSVSQLATFGNSRLKHEFHASCNTSFCTVDVLRLSCQENLLPAG